MTWETKLKEENFSPVHQQVPVAEELPRQTQQSFPCQT